MDILNTAHVRTPHDEDDRAKMNDEGCPNHPVSGQKPTIRRNRPCAQTGLLL